MKKNIIALFSMLFITTTLFAQEKKATLTDNAGNSYTFTALGPAYVIGKNIFVDDNTYDKGTANFHLGKGSDGYYYATTWNTIDEDNSIAVIKEEKFKIEEMKKAEIRYVNVYNDYLYQNKVWIVNVKIENKEYLPLFNGNHYDKKNNKVFVYPWDILNLYFKTEAEAKAFSLLFK
jgi:hypothetical protein